MAHAVSANMRKVVQTARRESVNKPPQIGLLRWEKVMTTLRIVAFATVVGWAAGLAVPGPALAFDVQACFAK